MLTRAKANAGTGGAASAAPADEETISQRPPSKKKRSKERASSHSPEKRKTGVHVSSASSEAHASSIPLKTRETKSTEAESRLVAVEVPALKARFSADPPEGEIIRPNLKNPSGSACFINSAIQMLAVALDDKFLNTLSGASCPCSVTTGLEHDARRECKKAWENLRNSFCQWQYALRHPRQRYAVLKINHLNNLIRTLDNYGSATGDQDIKQTIKRLLGSARSAEQVERQQDVDELLILLYNIFADCHPEVKWSGQINLAYRRQVTIDHIKGVPVCVNLESETYTPDCCYRMVLPLDHQLKKGAGAYFQSCLDINSGKVAQEHSTARVENRKDARRAYKETLKKIRENKTKLTSKIKEAAIQQIQEKLKTIQDDFDTEAEHPMTEQVTIHMGKETDTLMVMLKGYQHASTSGLRPGWDDMKNKRVPGRLSWTDTKGEGTRAKPQVKYRKDRRNGTFYFQNRMPVGGPSARETHARQHAQSAVIARRFYQIALCPVLDNYAISRKEDGKECYYIIKKDPFVVNGNPYIDEDPNADFKPPQLDCRPGVVKFRITGPDWDYKEFLVIDAWLGNLDILKEGTGGLGTLRDKNVRVDFISGFTQERDTLYRTECNCFGYKAGEPRRRTFRSSAVADLATLREDPLFASVEDIHIVIGQEILRKITDEVIRDTVEEMEYDGDKDALITTLIQRKQSLLDHKVDNHERHKTEVMNKLGSSLEQFVILPDVVKLREEAVRAFIGSDGLIQLGNVVVDGEEREEVTGHVRSIVCHIGRDTSSGHYITLNRVGDKWSVLDDSLTEPGTEEGTERTMGPLSISQYMRKKGIKTTGISRGNPDGLEAVNTLLQDRDFDAMPYFMVYELENEEGKVTRPQWQDDFERQLLGEGRSRPESEPDESRTRKRKRETQEEYMEGTPSAVITSVPSGKRRKTSITPVELSSSEEEPVKKKRRTKRRSSKRSDEPAPRKRLKKSKTKIDPSDRMGRGIRILKGRAL